MLTSLLLGTSGGVYGTRGVPLALQGQLVTHLASTASGAAAGAVPRPGPVHAMYGLGELAAPQASGLHLLRHSSDGWTTKHVWEGDARACCIWDLPPGGQAGLASGGGSGSGSGSSSSGEVGLAVGTEPADVFVSRDCGASWSPGTSSFESAPSRPSWSFPAPPHEPHVLSLERTADGQLVAGIEVGGVLVGGGTSAGGFAEHNQGLYADVHSCRIDPHNPRHWLAVTGRGLYASDDAGGSWRAQGSWKGRYTIGLAFNPLRPGEVLVAAGDRPPAVGVHVYRSADGGESFQDITEAAFAGETAEAKGSRTPVPYFADGQALLGTATGHLLAADDAERRSWRTLCRLPHPVLCMCAPNQSPSSVMH